MIFEKITFLSQGSLSWEEKGFSLFPKSQKRRPWDEIEI